MAKDTNKDLLIVVDYQNDFVTPKGQVAKRLGNHILANSQRIAMNIQNAIDRWHEKDYPVLFIVSDYNSKYYSGEFKRHRAATPYGDLAKKGTWGHKLYKIKSHKKDKVTVKHYFDGFYKTNLEAYFKKEKVKGIVICGINTDVCVFHTALNAAVRGYKVSVIKDATATVSQDKETFLMYLKRNAGVSIITLNKVL